MGKIKLLVMDVDGTLTDGTIYIGKCSEIMKGFNVRDGYGIANLLPRLGITPVVISGRMSKIVERRASELGIHELHQGVSDKMTELQKIAKKYCATPDEIAYIGDDLNDLSCIRYCGFSACPNDSEKEVRDNVKYICEANGGHGAVREVIKILEAEIEGGFLE